MYLSVNTLLFQFKINYIIQNLVVILSPNYYVLYLDTGENISIVNGK